MVISIELTKPVPILEENVLHILNTNALGEGKTPLFPALYPITRYLNKISC